MDFWLWMFGAFTAGSVSTAFVLGLLRMNAKCTHQYVWRDDQKICVFCGEGIGTR